ncbi:pyridoxamine 5'-phosphate oxidase [Chloroflexia bacterium SDU3-3]|nr:pyridoxamine 5'-phosphate oxidase [Chloroflexia bacterium SDU3-3]
MAKMTPEAREAFLAAVHVGVLSIAEPDRGPLTVPIWYAYEPGGDLWVWTEATSRKAALLRQAGRASFCVQQETPPYKYVSIEGPVVAIDPATTDEIRHLVTRYLGAEATDGYLAALTGGGARDVDCVVRIRPERWLTFDEGAE